MGARRRPSWRALAAGLPRALALGLVAPPLAFVPGLNLPLALIVLAAQWRPTR